MAIYGEIPEVTLEDQRRLFDVDYWGVVHGCREALRRIDGPGAIINLGSVLSDVPAPLQGPYTAAKHAVKGFTDTLRIEIERSGRPISVTLIKPAAIDTPYADQARTYRDRRPTTPPPRYAPEKVADVILQACEKPLRETYVGGAATAMNALWRSAPKAYDWFARGPMAEQSEKKGEPASEPRSMRDNLYEPREDGQAWSRSDHGRHIPYQNGGGLPASPVVIAAVAAVGAAVALAARMAATRADHAADDAPARSTGETTSLRTRLTPRVFGTVEWSDRQAWRTARDVRPAEPRAGASVLQ